MLMLSSIAYCSCLQCMHIKSRVCFSIHWNVLCKYIIEYQQQRWAASQPGGFCLLIEHHLPLAGPFGCLPILESISVIKLAAACPADARGYDVGMRLFGRNESRKHHAILGCVCFAVAYVNECHAAERHPFG